MMTSRAIMSAVRLPDDSRLTRYAFAMRTINARLGALAAILVVISFNLSAQQEKTRAVEVVVIDQAVGGIAQAQIEAVPRPENFPQKVKTDDKGHASLRLNSGEYALSISAQGFKTSAQALTLSNRDGAGDTNQVVKVILKIGDTGSPTIIYSPDSVVVSDPDHSPIVFSPADFHALPHVTIKVHNGHTNEEESYSGVLLETLLAKTNAPVDKEFRKEALRTYLLASGTDGNSVLPSLAEVDSTFHAGQVIIADMHEGQPLGKNGPFQLIVPGDNRPARWVHNLNSITLQQAQ
jgi:Carboxypeptidase regulatory-like domain